MRTLFVLAAIFISLSCKGNVIDNLKTDDDVRTFLKTIIKSKNKFDMLATDKDGHGEKLAKTKFLKIDLNNDGLTDLLVNGSYLFAVVDNGKGKFHLCFIHDAGLGFLRYVLADTIKSTGLPKIIAREVRDFGKDNLGPKYDTLVVRYDGFVEDSSQPVPDNIKNISLKTSGCFGTCPIFEMGVENDGSAVYNAIEYNDRKGMLKGKIDTSALSNLFQLANYICLRPLKEKYAVNWTDDQGSTLTLTFKDGTVKEVQDYGMIGTFGLERLYDEIYRLRKSQKWKRR